MADFKRGDEADKQQIKTEPERQAADAPAELRALRNNLENALQRSRVARRGRIAQRRTEAAIISPLAPMANAAAAAETEAAADGIAAASLVPQKGDIMLASYNIHKCVGTDNIFDPQRIIEVIAGLNADILALQEVDKRFGARSGLLDLKELEKRTGLRPAPIHTISRDGQGWHGNALFFRTGAIFSIEQIALPGVEPRGALIVDFHLKQGPLRVIAAHFGLLRRSRALQASAILAFLKNKQNMPTVLLGDLNEWRIGKNSSLNGLMPFFANRHEAPSFPSRFPLLPLDRVFSMPHNLVRALAVYDSALARAASDHLPIQALLRLQKAAGNALGHEI